MNAYSTNARCVKSDCWFVVLTLFLIFACVGCNLKSDAVLKKRFDTHLSDFALLATMSTLDRNVARLQVESVRPTNEISMSEERWQEYQRLFHKLDITQGMEHPYNNPSVALFYAECRGSAISRDCKGYAYSSENLTPIKDSLDKLAPGISFKPLSQNWYLFRDGG
jgi:hypothetical protein